MIIKLYIVLIIMIVITIIVLMMINANELKDKDSYFENIYAEGYDNNDGQDGYDENIDYEIDADKHIFNLID